MNLGLPFIASCVFATTAAASAECIPTWDDRFEPSNAPIIFGLAVAAFDSGSGPEIYVGNPGSSFGGVPSRGIGRWSRSAWRGLNGGIASAGEVRALAVFDDGNGPKLYVGGRFFGIGGEPIGRLATWDGERFQPFPLPVGDIQFLYVGTLDPAKGHELFIAEIQGRILKWDGKTLQTLRSDGRNVNCLQIYDDGTGPKLFAAGYLGVNGDPSGVEVLTSNGWIRPNGGIPQLVTTLAVFDDGSGPELYAGGVFSVAGGVPAANIARWNGTNWAPVGGGLTGGVLTTVTSFVVHDDGTGAQLYASGGFLFAGTNVIPFVARWDGASWSSVGLTGFNGFANEMISILEPTGPALYATGSFEIAGGQPSKAFARYGCSAPIPGDLNCDGLASVSDIAPFVLALTNRQSYLANFPGCDDAAADVNLDGIVGTSDIGAFVMLILSQTE